MKARKRKAYSTSLLNKEEGALESENDAGAYLFICMGKKKGE